MSDKYSGNTLIKASLLLAAVVIQPGIHAGEEALNDPTAPLLKPWRESSRTGFSAAQLGQELLGLFSTYTLTSILIRGDERIAVINDERLHIGDELGRVRVAAIESGSVVLEGDGDVRVLNLHDQSIKTRIIDNQ